MYLITGARGNVGGEVLHAMLDAGQEVRALTRGGRPPELPAEVEAVAGDLNQPGTLSDALAGARGVFVLSGYADMPGLLSAVRDAGVERVVLLSSGAVAGGDPGNAVVHYNMVSEAAVRDSGLAWAILRPSGFHSNALEARERMSQSMPGEYVDAFFSFFADGTYDDSTVLPTVRELTGRDPRTFAQWAVAHAGAFT